MGKNFYNQTLIFSWNPWQVHPCGYRLILKDTNLISHTHLLEVHTLWKEDYFIYHAVIESMICPLLLKDGITPIKDGTDGMPLYLIGRHTTKFVLTTAILIWLKSEEGLSISIFEVFIFLGIQLLLGQIQIRKDT